MNKTGNAVQKQLQHCLNSLVGMPAHLRPVCVCGFDGFIDTLARPVMQAGADKVYFKTIRQFGEYIASKGGKSGSIELDIKSRRAGGNAPNFSLALASAGVDVHCMAAVGYPEPDPVFADLRSKCDTHGVMAPGLCTALEFDDGKIFLTQNDGIRPITYGHIRQSVGAANISAMVGNSDGIALLNWGEIDSMHQVWQDALRDFSVASVVNNRKKLLIDFADISARSDADINAVLALIKYYQAWFEIYISLNLNEYQRLCRLLAINSELDASSMQDLFHALCIDGLVAHTPRHSFFANHASCLHINNLHVPKPMINTGAGDHFNAGFMFGLLHQFDMQSALIMASAVSGLFISQGSSPDRRQLAEYLKFWIASCASPPELNPTQRFVESK